MKPHERLGLAIAKAGYTWTPEMRQAWEELDKQEGYLPQLFFALEAIVEINPPLPMGMIEAAKASIANTKGAIEE